MRSHDHIDVISNLDKGLLVMHSPQDRIVSVDNAINIYHLARPPKSFITLDGADHMLTNKKDALYAGQVIASWVSRYVDFLEEEKLKEISQTHNVRAYLISPTNVLIVLLKVLRIS